MACAADRGATLPGKDSACRTRQPAGKETSGAMPPGAEARSMTRLFINSFSSDVLSMGAGTVLKIRLKPDKCPARCRVSKCSMPAASMRAKSRGVRADTVTRAPSACNLRASIAPIRPQPITRQRAPCRVYAVCSIASCMAPSQVGRSFAFCPAKQPHKIGRREAIRCNAVTHWNRGSGAG